MGEFLRLLQPEEGGFIPMQEMLPSTQHEVYRTLDELGISELPDGGPPEYLRFLVRLDDGREVEYDMVRNCESTEQYLAWSRANVQTSPAISQAESRQQARIGKVFKILASSMIGLGWMYGARMPRNDRDSNDET